MNEISNLFVDLDPSGFVGDTAPCFMCGRLTYRVDLDYEAPFCNSKGCIDAIAEDLRRINLATYGCEVCGNADTTFERINPPPFLELIVCTPCYQSGAWAQLSQVMPHNHEPSLRAIRVRGARP